MFESLTGRLNTALSRLSVKGRLSNKDVDAAMRDVRMALLEADVDFRVTRQFVNRVKERADGERVFSSLSPGQTVVKIVHEELREILGGEAVGLQRAKSPPSVVMLVGLQGSGKTTTAAKLALRLRKDNQPAMLAACDLQRPAAIDQLVQLGRELNVPVHREDPIGNSPVDVARNAVKAADKSGIRWLILDTAGRLHLDEGMMDELARMRDKVKPAETLLVVDSMTGQDAVRSGSEFNDRIGLTGLILTKMDGDARGGAALSMKSATGLPIKFVGTGERASALEDYHPDRMASRILGMGDVQTLVERAQEQIDVEDAAKLERRMRRNQFDMNDLLQQFQALKNMGPLGDVLGMIPGMRAMQGRINPADLDERKMGQVEAIILSMTPGERANPTIIKGSRRKRIAVGSGTTPAQVNQLLNQHRQMQKVMRKLASGGNPRALMGMFGKS